MLTRQVCSHGSAHGCDDTSIAQNVAGTDEQHSGACDQGTDALDQCVDALDTLVAQSFDQLATLE